MIRQESRSLAILGSAEMGTLSKREDADLFSINRLSSLFGLDRATVTKRIAKVSPAGQRGGYDVYTVRDVAPHLVERAAQSDPDAIDPDKFIPRDRLDHYRAERERLKLQAEQRDVVPAAEVDRVLAAAFKSLSGSLDMLPDVLERECGLSVDAVQQCITAVDRARQALYDQLLELCDALGAEDIA